MEACVPCLIGDLEVWRKSAQKVWGDVRRKRRGRGSFMRLAVEKGDIDNPIWFSVELRACRFSSRDQPLNAAHLRPSFSRQRSAQKSSSLTPVKCPFPRCYKTLAPYLDVWRYVTALQLCVAMKRSINQQHLIPHTNEHGHPTSTPDLLQYRRKCRHGTQTLS